MYNIKTICSRIFCRNHVCLFCRQCYILIHLLVPTILKPVRTYQCIILYISTSGALQFAIRTIKCKISISIVTQLCTVVCCQTHSHLFPMVFSKIDRHCCPILPPACIKFMPSILFRSVFTCCKFRLSTTFITNCFSIFQHLKFKFWLPYLIMVRILQHHSIFQYQYSRSRSIYCVFIFYTFCLSSRIPVSKTYRCHLAFWHGAQSSICTRVHLVQIIMHCMTALHTLITQINQTWRKSNTFTTSVTIIRVRTCITILCTKAHKIYTTCAWIIDKL